MAIPWVRYLSIILSVISLLIKVTISLHLGVYVWREGGRCPPAYTVLSRFQGSAGFLTYRR